MKEYVSWEDVTNFVEKIWELCTISNVSGVYGVPRGGLVLAVLISYALNVPFLNAPCKNCIIVDDICDSGETLLHYYKNSSGDGKKNYYLVTMYYKENDLGVKPDLYIKNKKDKWIVFPWEFSELIGG